MNVDAPSYTFYDASGSASLRRDTVPYGALPPGRPAESYFGSALPSPAQHTVTPYGSEDSVDGLVREVTPPLDDDPLGAIPTNFNDFARQQQPRQSSAPAFEQQRQFKTRMCVYGDTCPYADGRCFFAHSEAELRPPAPRWWLPEYKTKPCRYSEAECPFFATGRCQFAHSVAELQRNRPTHAAKYKTRICKYAASGGCPYGANCSYAHDASELRAPPPKSEPRGEPDGVLGQLERLTRLRADGSISGAEFADLKERLMSTPGAFAVIPFV
mmetsp:Transcript_13397/g.39871  ORF Transcript_13397/g.39871 Transcript_13397/m.39871 type:complete len:271 (+) Transcript_13397:219-1031(+)|eukprot:CAMPEP_0119269396 /NCGR_PEP_ID=MMETSP1329-20130426/6826_1 /TAXON_ID=114041 /ORGANISM="Genus nov. species nov., Strain RCC1024" /LENGTH=270 /DNA_ID=CAMNT_0007269395 /DNA_START=184 /DNA_END=996 /DNA_ORIENTATION=+